MQLELCCYKRVLNFSTVAFPRSFGPGSARMPIYLDEVACNGTESRLADCGHRGIGIHDCVHSEDAGVVCQGEFI